MVKNAVVTITLDHDKKRLRAQATINGVTGWVRFPKHLRTSPGQQYRVETLKIGLGNSFIATGNIYFLS